MLDEMVLERTDPELSANYSVKSKQVQVGFFEKNPIERSAANDDDVSQ